MKKYLLRLVISGAAARLGKYAGAALARKKISGGGGMRNLLIGAAAGAGLIWLLEQKKRR